MTTEIASDLGEVAELRAQLAVYEDAQAIAHIGSWRSRPGPEVLLELSAEARRILGVGKTTPVSNLDLFNLVHPADRDVFLATVVRVRTEGVRCPLELRIIRPDRAERVVLIVLARPDGTSDIASGLFGTIQDVTEDPPGGGRHRRSTAERELEQAISSEELFLEYQPILSLEDDRIAGAEALVRWRHPSRGRIGPDDFIELAEASGLIVPLGRWVFDEACRELRRWQDAGVPQDFRLSINLSPVQLEHEGFADELAASIEDAGVPWSSIVLEVTESFLVEDAYDEMLCDIRDRGALIAIDDFGVRFSALGYLPRLSVDSLKIDASFVQGIDDGAGRAVSVAIAAMGRALGLGVTAEGIETESQLSAVREIGCQFAQGFLIARPVSGAECLEMLLGSD